MTVVSNASPLIILAKLRLFDLPCRLFNQLTISREVWNEVVINGRGMAGAIEAERGVDDRWIRVLELSDAGMLVEWRKRHSLGAGELSTILLAKQIKADLTLIDERAARLLARSVGLNVLGTVGLLELGYLKGLVADLTTTYQELVANGARIDRSILNRSLVSMGLAEL